MFSSPKAIHPEKSAEITSIEQKIKKQSDDKGKEKQGVREFDLKLIENGSLNKFFLPEKKQQIIFAIIDMQPTFIAAKKQVMINSFKKALNNAMTQGQYILFVNYDLMSKIYVQGKWVAPIEERNADKDYQVNPVLNQMVAAYPNKATIWKCTDSGATEILEHLKSKKIAFEKICIAGVNICACVSSTVEDLSSKSQKGFLIELNNSCCSCDCSFSEELCTRESINKLERYKNVISDKGNNILKSALEKRELENVNEILSLYDKSIVEYIESKNDDKLIEIKRDLLSSLYFLKCVNRPISDRTIELSNKLNQLLEKLQVALDELNAKRCVIM
jgi:nicotinamidase-related amidase